MHSDELVGYLFSSYLSVHFNIMLFAMPSNGSDPINSNLVHFLASASAVLLPPKLALSQHD